MMHSLTIEPDAASWPASLADALARWSSARGHAEGGGRFARPPLLLGEPLPAWVERTRAELFGDLARAEGDAVRPVIATGHQANFWHPGILAKYLALDAFAAAVEDASPTTADLRARGGLRVELVVDQDANDPLVVIVPGLERDAGHGDGVPGHLVRYTVRLGTLAPADDDGEDPAAAVARANNDARNMAQPPVGFCAPARVLPPTAEEADALRGVPDFVSAGVAAMRRALLESHAESADAATLADQVAEALEALRERGLGQTDPVHGVAAAVETSTPGRGTDRWPRTRLRASDLTRTTLWRALLAAWRVNPVPAVQAYNRAVAAVPEAGMPPLALPRGASAGLATAGREGGAAEIDPAAVELPLWVLEPGHESADDEPDHHQVEQQTQHQTGYRRRRAMWQDLLDRTTADGVLTADARARGVHLMPRAILMTGLMRLAVCDLFIHGLGGQVYDRITEKWFADSAARFAEAQPSADFAPNPDTPAALPLASMVAVSATLHLPFDDAPPATREAERAAVQRARHLRFNLDRALDLDHARQEKARLLDEIERLPRRSMERRQAYLAIQNLNAALADKHAAVIAAAVREADDLARRLAERAVREERTWPFAIYPTRALHELQQAIRQAFSI